MAKNNNDKNAGGSPSPCPPIQKIHEYINNRMEYLKEKRYSNYAINELEQLAQFIDELEKEV